MYLFIIIIIINNKKKVTTHYSYSYYLYSEIERVP